MAALAAQLDSEKINAVVDAFPCEAGWHVEYGNAVASETDDGPDWSGLEKPLPNVAGLYAFLFPVSAFSSEFTFRLHAPRKKGKARFIPFCVRPQDLEEVKIPGDSRRYFVAYVGRTAHLGKRIRQHFHATKGSTAAQVRVALKRCMGLGISAAIEFMLEHAVIVYHELPGPENVANRDIIEVSLWAIYRSPFNIKSER